jgi:peptidoglycan/LPS O-acetylase OafA/YrhL
VRPWAVRSSSHRTLLWTNVGVVAMSPGLRIVLDWYGMDLYANPFCRLDGLMAGALLAAVVRMERRQSDGICRAGADDVHRDGTVRIRHRISRCALDRVFVRCHRVDGVRIFVPFAALESWGGWNESLAAFCVGLMLCYVLAFLSWHLLERPFLSLRRFFAPPPSTY